MTQFTQDLIAQTDAYLESLEKSGSNMPENPSAAQQEPEQGIIGDTVDTFQRGAYLGLQGVGEAAYQFAPGIGSDIGAAVRDFAGERADLQMEEMSPRMREAMGKQIFDEDADGNLMLGDGAYDGYTWLGNVSQAVGQYADIMLGGAGLARAGLATSAKIAGKVAAKKAAKSGAGKTAAEAAGKQAAEAVIKGRGRDAAALIGYGTAGSMMAGGMVGEQTREEVLNLPGAVLDQSEEYQKAYWQLAEQNPESDVTTLRQQAKELIAEKAAAEVQRDPMLIASNFAMDAIGGKFLDDIFRGVGTGARTTNAMKQMGIQGSTEAMQGGIEQYASNQAIIENADPTRDPWQDVKSNAATEGVMGGIIGGAGGLASKGQAPVSDGSMSTEGLPDYQPENDQPLGLDAPEKLLGLPYDESYKLEDQNIIYGDQPKQSAEQIRARKNTNDAFEAQHGAAQNTGLEGEYLGQSLPGEAESERAGDTIDGEVVRDPELLENPGTLGLPDSGIIFAGTDAEPKAKPADGMTEPYTQPKQSRKALSRQEEDAEAQPEQKAPIAKGKRDKAFTPDNQAIDVSYSVIDLADLKVSHDESGKANPDYPAEMQPRDRRNFASQLQIRKLAAGLQPERLAESANVGDGAPIIGPDGVVESGNGRAAAIRLAYRANGHKAKSYKQFVQQRARELGVPADQLLKMKQPVLVRTRETEADRAEFARRANKPQLSTMNDFEQALSDAQYIDQGMLSAWKPSESDGALAASNRDFIRAFSKALGDNETAGLITNDGRATARFGQRMQAAIFAKAYDSPKLVEMLTDNTDGFRNIIGGLREAAPDFAAAKTLDANAGADMVRSISDAVELLDRSRQSGMTVKELLAQQDAFTTELPAETRNMAEFMSVNRLRPKALSDTMRALGQMVRQEAENSTTASLFGDTEITNRELIDESIRRSEAQTDERAYQVPADEGGRTGEQRPTARGADDTDPGRAETVAGVSGQNESEGNARVIDQDELTADAFDLQPQTEQDLQQQADATAKAEAEQAAAKKAEEERAQADAELGDFSLTGSDSTVDQLEAQGQSNLFDAPTEQNTDKQAAKMRPDGRRADGLPINPADTFETSSGRITTPYPKQKGEKYRSQWLIDNAKAEAESRADEFNATIFGDSSILKDGTLTDSDRESMTEYLFGEQPATTNKTLNTLTGDPGANKGAAEQSSEQPAKSSEQEKPKASKNKVFTEDMAEKARARLRRKMSQLNSGLDPEMLQDGIVLAGYHIEKHARKFTAFASAMLDDMGEGIRPYLKQFYLAAKMDPRMPPEVAAEMDKASTVEDFDIATATTTPSQEADDVSNTPDTETGATGNRQDSESESESDSGRGRSDRSGRDDRQAGVSGREGQSESGSRMGTGRAAAERESGGQPSAEEASGSRSGDTGNTDSGRSSVHSPARVLAERKRVEPVKSDPKPAPARVTEPAADGRIKPADLAEVKAQMPFLTDGQADDVVFAEKRFNKPDGHGVLFTNGTGTGKTFTGLGVISRFWRSGKKNILIAAPSQAILNSWVKAAKGFFGLNVNVLPNTSSAGKEITATTFANLGNNDALVSREWDLIVVDEAHYLSSGQEGKSSLSHQKINMLAMKEGVAESRARALNPELSSEIAELSKKIESNRRSDDPRNFIGANSALEERLKDLHRQMTELSKAERKRIEAVSEADKPRGLFLSATPFAYVPNVAWAQGWLFDWGGDQNGLAYNSGGNRERFFMEHFGYKMRYNKLTRPGPEVDSGLMERQFNSYLKQEGVLSSRKLDSDFDYDRKFILTETALGHRIDEALKWLREKSSGDGMIEGVSELAGEIESAFDYHTRIYLLEALKAREAIPYIRKNLDLGRNVVVMHDRKKGGVKSPFLLSFAAGTPEYSAYKVFRETFSDLVDGFGFLPSVIDTLTNAFPDAMVYNGSVPAKERIKIQDRFNDDANKSRLIIAQGDSMREGVSVHDTTGKHQRVLMHLGLPVKPVASIQQEGRIYRVGQASDAVFRYFTIGTTWERSAFASTIAERSSTAENLAMGEEARGLKEAFIDAYENADSYLPGPGEGKGGKASDAEMTAALTPWDSAKAFYFATKKQGKGRSARGRENSEFFATPEPVGLKMVEMADIRSEEKVLEPSAGHGAIARWMPENTTNRAIELEGELSSKLALRFDGDVVTGSFEDHNIVNKYDAIVMNPPFGQGGKQAADHVAKAIKHLRDGGRIVALIPTGPAADKRFDKLLFNNDETKDIYTAAEVQMPGVTFERAGTSVRTRILVLEKQTDPDKAALIQQQNRDYTDASSIGDLFDRMENLEIKPRQKRAPQNSRPEAAEVKTTPAGELEIIEHTTKKGKVIRGIVRTDLTRDEAKEIDPYTFKKDGGFFIRERHLADQLDSLSDQQTFDNEYPNGMTAEQVSAIADDLGNLKQHLNIVATPDDLPMVVKLANMIKGIPPWAQQGVYRDGKVYIVASNLRGTQEAIDTIVHEVVGHAGMRALLGKELTPVMLQIYDSFQGTAAMEQLQEKYDHYDPKDREHQQYLAEELLAHAAEYGEKPGLVKRAIAQIRRLLRKAFPNIAWTSNDIYALIDSARRFVERKNAELGGQNNDNENLSRLFGSNPVRAADAYSDLNDDAKAALRKIAPETLKQKAGHWLKQVWDRAGLKLRQGMVDRYAALMDLDKKRFGEKAFEENITSSSFILARMAANASGAVSALMQHGRIHWDSKEKVIDVQPGTETSGGLTQVLYKLGTSVEIERFMGWIAGNRAAKLAEEGRENLFTKEEIEALKSVNTGTTESGKDRAKLYDEVFSEFQQYRDDVLSIAEQAGIITSENRDMWKDEFYVPFYRVADEDLKANGPVNSKGLTRQEAYKKLKGGKQNLNDLLENTLMNFHHLIDASLKNIAATQAIDNAADLGAAQITAEAARDKDNSTWIMRDGKKEWYNIGDPLVYNSLVALTAPAMQGPVMKAMRFAKRMFTQTVTITPQFQVANLLRDSMQAIATSKMPYNAGRNAAKGMAAYGVWNKESATRARMMATGGSMSFGHIYGADAEGVKLAVNSQLKSAKLLKLSNGHQILKGLWDKWMDVNDSFENANRAAIFEHNYKDGQKLKAAWEARDLIDFSAHGAWPTIRFLIDTVPFMNARIQGLDKLYRSGAKPTAKVIREAFGGPGASASDKAAAKRFNIVTGAIALATMSLYLANKDDEEYKKLEEWQKDTYWFIRMGDSAVFIPKPFEVGAIATFAERILEQIVDDDATGELFAQRMGHMLSDTFSMNPTPQLFNPALEVFANHNNFTDRPIESMGQQRLSPGMRQNAGTSSIAAGIGGALNISPLQIDHLIQGYFGQLGAWTLSATTTMTDIAQGKSTPEKAWTEYQPIRRFYRDLKIPGYTKYQTLFYDRLNEVRTVYADIKKYRELGELEKAAAMANQHQSELAQRLTMERISRRLSKLNARARVVRASGMDGELKRRKLDRIQTMKNRLTEITMKQIKDAA